MISSCLQPERRHLQVRVPVVHVVMSLQVQFPSQVQAIFQHLSMYDITASKLVVYGAAGGTIYYLWKFLKFFTRPYFSPLRQIRCVPRSSVLLGSLRDVNRMEDSTLHEEWSREFGTAFRLKMFMNVSCYESLGHFVNSSSCLIERMPSRNGPSCSESHIYTFYRLSKTRRVYKSSYKAPWSR